MSTCAICKNEARIFLDASTKCFLFPRISWMQRLKNSYIQEFSWMRQLFLISKNFLDATTKNFLYPRIFLGASTKYFLYPRKFLRITPPIKNTEVYHLSSKMTPDHLYETGGATWGELYFAKQNDLAFCGCQELIWSQ